MMNVYDLKTEYRVTPIGIDNIQPRFSWKIKSDEKNLMQTGYQILAFEDENENRLLWDSGKVDSDQSVGVLWNGKQLTSAQRVYWKVKVSTQTGIAESELTFFEMGLLKAADWEAKWIEPEREVEPDQAKAAPILRKEFWVNKPLKKARIYQSAHGLYEFWINGEIGTEDKFKPGFTSYYNRIQYQVYDITELVETGKNCWAVMLGDGWWRGTTGAIQKNNFGYKAAYIGQIVLEYTDGTKETIFTDKDMKCAIGGLLLSDMRMGDIYDASLEPENWKKAGFNDSHWNHVYEEGVEHADIDTLIASESVPVREKETFDAKVRRTPNGELVLDFGQNIAGYVKMHLRNGKPGQKVTLRYGETLDKNGNFTQDNLVPDAKENRFQTVTYIMQGKEEEYYCPNFSVFGFQYVLLEGYEEEIQQGDFIAVAVYSDLEETGEFTCSNSLINKLVQNSKWSQKGNFLDVPTDCPTRERSTWTGDSQVYIRTASCFMNVYPFFEKWMLDFVVEQFPSGKVANTVPATNSIHNQQEILRMKKELEKEKDPAIKAVKEVFLSSADRESILDGSAGWADAAVINPYTMYLCYGDKKIVSNQYESAKKWVDYIVTEAQKTNPVYTKEEYYQSEEDAGYVWDTGFHWGEWLEPDMNELNSDFLNEAFAKPDYKTATMYYFYSSKLLSRMAKVLGKKEDEKKYKEISEKVKQVYNKYFISEDGTIVPGRQAPHVRALAFGLVDQDKEETVAAKLAELVKENKYKLNTGFLSTVFLLPVLSENGYKDVAFKVLEQTESPGWLFNVKAGATTIPENWSGYENCKDSFNHYSYGAVCQFLFEQVAGIQPVFARPGYKHFILKPTVGGSLTEAKAVYESLYGVIESSWKKNKNSLEYRFQVPANTTATIILPIMEKTQDELKRQYPSAQFKNNSMIFEVGSGERFFSLSE